MNPIAQDLLKLLHEEERHVEYLVGRQERARQRLDDVSGRVVIHLAKVQALHETLKTLGIPCDGAPEAAYEVQCEKREEEARDKRDSEEEAREIPF